KNILSTTMHSYTTMMIVSVQWILIGYSLAFGPDMFGFIGNLDWAGLKGVGFEPNPDYSSTLPHNLFMMFQLMFAILTPAIISGAYAERMKFSAFIIFTLLWTTFIYDPVAHWVWGVGGWLRELGALDFAGGNVVHITSGVSGLVIAVMLGKRKSGGVSTPHSLPFTILGAGLLWFGWFGFNVGSALTINEVAMNAFVTTNTAAAMGSIGWLAVEWFYTKKPTVLGAVSGAVSGLVAITPACGFVTPVSSIIIGFIGGVVCYIGVSYIKSKFDYDDALDAFGLHGIGGTWGGIATGIFASTKVNEAGADGLIYGSISLLNKQLIAIGATWAFSIVGTFVLLYIVKKVVGLRVDDEVESIGLDLSIHGEKAYDKPSF
ncbi:MAG: ammonium transporter, partial [Bacillales bacterium]|nr:ammonium transporter [Bacillales bacterium]